MAVYTWEDRAALHRQKADEAYLIGEARASGPRAPGHRRDHPRREAVRRRCDLPRLRLPLREPGPGRARCAGGHHFHRAERGGAGARRQQGRRPRSTRRRPESRCWRRARRPPTSQALIDAAERSASRFSPRRSPAVAVAACAGSRRRTSSGRRSSRRCARRRRRSATASMFLEQAVLRPRHIEVQILADARRSTSSTCSSATARCSVATRRSSRSRRRRTSTRGLREAICTTRSRSPGRSATSTPARSSSWSNRRPGARLHRDEPAHPGRAHRHRGGHRCRPRAGAVPDRRRARRSPSSGSHQESIHVRGAALQCRITTEDPANDFRPDTGRISAYRSPGGAGIRLDGGTATPAPRSCPTSTRCSSKMTARGPDFADRGRAAPSAARRVPHPRARDEHCFPPGGAATIRTSSPGDLSTVVHRGAPELLEPRESATAAPRSSPGSPT